MKTHRYFLEFYYYDCFVHHRGTTRTFWSRLHIIGSSPKDTLASKIAQKLQTNNDTRARLTEGIYISKDKNSATGRLENAFLLKLESEKLLKKVKNAIRKRVLPKEKPMNLIKLAIEKKILTKVEGKLLLTAEEARYDTIQVDSYTLSDYKGKMKGMIFPKNNLM